MNRKDYFSGKLTPPRGVHFFEVAAGLKEKVRVHDAGDQNSLAVSRPFDVIFCNNVLGHLGHAEGARLVSWLYHQRPRYLMTAGQLWGHGYESHSLLDLQVKIVSGSKRVWAPLYKIDDWAGQKPFRPADYRCVRL